jgi:hypothetical protein
MESPPLLKTSLNYGALSGLGSFIVFFILISLGKNPLGPASWAGAWIPILFMVLATRHYRDHENNGFVSYWQAFRIGFLTASAGALLFGALSWLYVTMIDNSVLDTFKQESLEALELTEGMMKSMIGESAFEQSIENINNMSMNEVTTSDIFNKMFGGLLSAFITAAFLRREPVLRDEE